jgi:nicotinate-nucleotide adenylyltransferase
MRLIVPPAGEPRRLGILAGTFNPPTRAHLAIAEAALTIVDQVLLVLPGVLPHKTWDGAPADSRLEMLRRVASGRPRIGAAVADGGLCVELVREARELFPGTEMYVVCGRDAAERIVGWDYGSPDAVLDHLKEFRLLVAPRNGPYRPPVHLSHAVRALSMPDYDECASTRVREGGSGWRDLVPEEIADLVAALYGRG